MDTELSKRVKAIVADTYLVYDSSISADNAFDVFMLIGETRQISIFQSFRSAGASFLKEDMSLMYNDILRLLCDDQNRDVCSSKRDNY